MMRGADIAEAEDILPLICLCRELNQITYYHRNGKVKGMAAWLRCSEDHLELFKHGTFEEMRAKIRRRELRKGPCLVICELVALVPGVAYHAVRDLADMPGVARVAARRRGRWVSRLVRRRRSGDGTDLRQNAGSGARPEPT
jgi:hypothetical protein